MSRPEHTNAPEDFYNEVEAKKYAQSTRMLAIQRVIAERCLELLNLPVKRDALLLDVGCGSGLSGQVIGEAGHTWIGMDISAAMLNIAANDEAERAAQAGSSDDDDDEEDDDDRDEEEEDEEEDMDMEEEEDDEEEDEEKEQGSSSSKVHGSGDVALRDMGQGLGLRANTFDGVISVSAVQWLCYSHHSGDVPQRRLKAFFSSLYTCLRRGGRAAIQLYPESPEQMELITNAAMSCGFTGGVVVDYPNSAKAKKFYLVLFAGQPSKSSSNQDAMPRPKGVGTGAAATLLGRGSADSRKRSHAQSTRGGHAPKGSKVWIENKKEAQRKRGAQVRPDSKYSGRKRSKKF